MNWSELTNDQKSALVAEKVMGWKEIEFPPECKGKIECGILAPPHYVEWLEKKGGQNRSVLCHLWITDIERAFQVVDKMREKGFVVRLDNGLDGTWEATFYNRGYNDQFYAPADTLPEAICLAALRACGVEIE